MAKLTSFVYLLLLLTVQPLVAQCLLIEIAGAAGGATLMAVGAPVVLGALGFTTGGITACSVAAKLMAVVYQTNVGLGVLSTLQSAGAAGIGASTVVAGGAVGAGVLSFCYSLIL